MKPILQLESILRVLQVEYVREYKFDKKRKWRFDFADTERMIAYEYEGISVKKGKHRGRHLSIGGYSNDREKYNHAQISGWKVLSFTWPMLRSGLAFKQIEAANNDSS